MRVIFRQRAGTARTPEGPPRRHFDWRFPGDVGDQEVHGEVLAVDEVVHNVPDIRGHDVAVDVAVIFVVESRPSQDHAKNII